MHFLNTLGGIPSLWGVALTLYLWIAEFTSNEETPNSFMALGGQCVLYNRSITLLSTIAKGGMFGKNTDERARVLRAMAAHWFLLASVRNSPIV